MCWCVSLWGFFAFWLAIRSQNIGVKANKWYNNAEFKLIANGTSYDEQVDIIHVYRYLCDVCEYKRKSNSRRIKPKSWIKMLMVRYWHHSAVCMCKRNKHRKNINPQTNKQTNHKWIDAMRRFAFTFIFIFNDDHRQVHLFTVTVARLWDAAAAAATAMRFYWT